MSVSITSKETRNRPTGRGSLWDALFAGVTGAWIGGVLAWVGGTACVVLELVLYGRDYYFVSPSIRFGGKVVLCWVIFGAGPGALVLVRRLSRSRVWRTDPAQPALRSVLASLSLVSSGSFFLLHGLLPMWIGFLGRTFGSGPFYSEAITGLFLLIIGLRRGWRPGKVAGSKECEGDPVSTREGLDSGRRRLPAERLTIVWGGALVLVGTLLPWGLDFHLIGVQVLGPFGPPCLHGIDGLCSRHFGYFRDHGGTLVLGLAAVLMWLVLSRPRILSRGPTWARIYAGGLLSLSLCHVVRLGLFRLVAIASMGGGLRSSLRSEWVVKSYVPVFWWGEWMCGTIGPGLLLVCIGSGLMLWAVMGVTRSRVGSAKST